MLGCTNRAAKNYDPSATEDDGSCVYLTEIEGVCYEFEDVPNQNNIEDTNFTLSYSIPEANWVFFHDYFPDYYFATRTGLYNIKDSKIYEQNKGPRGVYHGSVKPFFIDVLFANRETTILNAVNWVSEIRGPGNVEARENREALFNETITAITIWNNYQCTGRIVLDKANAVKLDRNNRNSEQEWSFNKFRDLAKQDVQFLDSVFKDYAVLSDELEQNLPWYKKRLMNGKYFIIRFEFDNLNNKQITMHDFEADVSVSIR